MPYCTPFTDGLATHPANSERVRHACAARLLGDASKFRTDYEANLGGEDYAFFGQHILSAYMLLGTGNKAKGVYHGLHSPNYTLDEAVLPVGAAYHAALATEFLANHGSLSTHDEL